MTLAILITQFAILIIAIFTALKQFHFSSEQKKYYKLTSAANFMSELEAMQKLAIRMNEKSGDLERKLQKALDDKAQYIAKIELLKEEFEGYREKVDNEVKPEVKSIVVASDSLATFRIERREIEDNVVEIKSLGDQIADILRDITESGALEKMENTMNNIQTTIGKAFEKQIEEKQNLK